MNQEQFLCLMACIVLVLGLAGYASANQPINDPVKAAELQCSEASIMESRRLVASTRAEAKNAMASVIVSPEAKLMAKINNTLAVMSLENLMTNCAILKRLDRGI